MTRLPRLMTARMIVEETGLPLSTVTSIMRRLPKVESGTKRVLVRRDDVDRILASKATR